MKTVVSVQEIAELEIKPRAEVEEWRRLVAQEVRSRWKDRSKWIAVPCPACASAAADPAFERIGIAYVECHDCGSVYAPRRPSEAMLREWYRESAPARFWRERLLPVSAAARQEKIVRPRADWVLDGIAEYAPDARQLIDLSPHGHALVETIAAGAPALTALVSAGQTADLEGQATVRIRVRPTSVADLPGLGPADLALGIDVWDRAADPRALAASLERTLAPGGVLFATFTVASGFEIQALWERSPIVQPPDKLNLLSVEGLMKLFAPPAWEVLELSTPGMFDVETVHQAIAANPTESWPRVVRSLVERSDAAGRKALVEFLQTRRLTSFARLVARRSR